jgi:hypothetical protein
VIGALRDSDLEHQAGAVYVHRYDGSSWIQAVQLFASDEEMRDEFGVSVAISGDTFVVGSHFDDDGGTDSGSAYVFQYDGSQWNQVSKLTASDASAYDNFGWSVAISGDVVVVGANLDDDGGPNSGSAYVFRKPPGGWIRDMTETAKLTASDDDANDEFGRSVAIDGEVVVVGAHYDLDGGGNMTGAAYVFRYTGFGWAQEAKLTASDGVAQDRFGLSVAIDGDVAVIGAWADDDGGTQTGSTYVYVKPATGWKDMTQTAKLTASDAVAGNHFGWSVAMEDDVVAIGAPAHLFDGSGWGAVYVFEKPAAGWTDTTETGRFTASDAAHEDQYGYSVSINGNRLVAGSRRHDTALNDASGAAYVHGGLSDCQPNGVIDVCDLTNGTSTDDNGNGIPDDCEGTGGGAGSTEDSLVVDKTAGPEITLSWGPSCIVGDNDFEIYEGLLGDFASHTVRLCTTGGALQMTLLPYVDNSYYLVAPRNDVEEGSLGKDSEGVERPEGLTACLPRVIAECR